MIFDWGGTLSVWANIDIEDMWRLAARHLAPDREDELVAALTAIEARSWERVGTDQRSTRLSELLQMASSELSLDVAGVMLEDAAAHHLDSWTPHIRHHPEAVPVLQALREQGVRIGLLSNTHWPRGFHERFLQRDGLAELIDARLYTSEMEYVKPHPSVFKAALAAVGGAEPGRSVFVGDRLHDDVHGARAAGMRAVWVRNSWTDGFDAEPDAVIDSLAELPDVVAAWA